MRSTGLLILAVAALAVPALAQDSVSNNLGGLPGDALSPWSTTQQNANYVVDLTPFVSSWGTRFAIAPLVKSSKGAFYSGSTPKEYFNDLISAQSISRLHAQSVPFATSSYFVWTNAAGAGVNTLRNSTPGTISPTGTSNQFAVVAEEYGSSAANVSFDAIFGAVVNYAPSDPNRLYVRRVLAAVNSVNQTVTTAAFGIGSCDEAGNVMFRADNSGTNGTNKIAGNNIFRVNMPARNFGLLNSIDNTAPADAAATTWIVQRHARVHTTPNIGPAAKFGGSVFYLGENFGPTSPVQSGEYGYGPVSPPTYVRTHIAPPAVDHRGAMAYTTKTASYLGGTAGTGASIAKATFPSGDPAQMITLWGINANGSVASTKLLTLPTIVTDNATGDTNYGPPDWPSQWNAFGHYASQTAYRGGTGQVAMNVDQQGRLLVAAVVYNGDGFATDACNYIAVARISPDGNTTEWTMAAYTQAPPSTYPDFGYGKPVLEDGPGGAEIARMTLLTAVTGGSPFGPSISAPMIDSVGNIWFISAVQYPIATYPYYSGDTWLIRAVYDPATFSYHLEKVLETGDVFQGNNSGRPWQLRFLSIADSNSVDSATAYSSNISENGFLGAAADPSWETRDPRALGGLVLQATIVYDIDGDGEFNDPTSTYYNPSIPADEAYSALIYIAANPELAPPLCPGDGNCDGLINFSDIDFFVAAIPDAVAGWTALYTARYGHAPTCAFLNNDCNHDGHVNFSDIDPFVALIPSVCP